MIILYTAFHLMTFLHLSSPKRRKLNQRKVEYVDGWMNGWLDGDYIKQEIRDVFLSCLNRTPLCIFREKAMRMRREKRAWESQGDDSSLKAW